MTCLVVKWINGHPYLYRQHSYRVGKQVRNDPIYLGRADGLLAAAKEVGATDLVEGVRKQLRVLNATDPTNQMSPASEISAGVQAQIEALKTQAQFDAKQNNVSHTRISDSTRDQLRELAQANLNPKFLKQMPPVIQESTSQVKRTNQKTPRIKRRVNPTNKGRVFIQTRVKLGKIKISQAALERESKTFVAKLESLGMDCATLPKVKIKYGKELQHKKNFFSNQYTVTLPRGTKYARNKAKQEYSRCLVRAGLDLMRDQQPQRFAALAEAFNPTFKQTKACLYEFLKHSNDKGVTFKLIALVRWGRVIAAKGSKLEPDALGVVAFDRNQKNWEDDAVMIAAEANKRGYGNYLSQVRDQQKRARREYDNANAAFKRAKSSSMRRKVLKRIARAKARKDALDAQREKIRLLREVFDA